MLLLPVASFNHWSSGAASSRAPTGSNSPPRIPGSPEPALLDTLGQVALHKNARLHQICAVPDRRLHSIHRSGGERLSSCRKRLRSTSRPRLALHEALPLDFKLEGTTTVGDQILIRPRRGDWSRSTGQSVFCFHSSGLQRFWPRREKPSLFRPLRQFVDRRPIPGLRAGSG